jgi:hypothetical protein
MNSFLDRFGARRRQAPRVAVAWRVGIGRLPGTPSPVLATSEVSRLGLRLQGGSAEGFRAAMSDEGAVELLLWIPGSEAPLTVEAELRWGLAGGTGFLSGWRFARIDDAAQRTLDEYIAAHPEQVLRPL